jgi:hypothetical protein
MTTTVLSVEQGDKSAALVTPTLLKGLFKSSLYKFIHVSVPNTDKSDAGRIPARIISDAAKGTAGKKILLGNSTGCSYLAKGIRDGAFDGYSDDELEFWLLANPERRYGGWCNVPAPMTSVLGSMAWNIAPFGGVGVPADAPWRIVDFAQRYDVCADAATAKDPGIWYRLYAGSVGVALHLNYFTVSPDDPVVKRYREGNIEYMLHSPHIDAGFEQFYTRPAFV